MALVFCINSMPRAGTMLVQSTLTLHPEIICFAEIFGSGANDAPPAVRKKPMPQVFEILQNWPGKTAAGFCIHRRRLMKAYVRNPAIHVPSDMPVIFLWRENILRQMVSHRMAKRTKIWTVTSKRKRIKRPKITIGPVPFEKYVKDMERKNQDWKRFKRVLRVSYEELLADPQDAFARMQEFLRVPVEELTPPTVKLGGAIRPVLSTYDRLKEHCKDTRWAKFFDE